MTILHPLAPSCTLLSSWTVLRPAYKCHADAPSRDPLANDNDCLITACRLSTRTEGAKADLEAYCEPVVF